MKIKLLILGLLLSLTSFGQGWWFASKLSPLLSGLVAGYEFNETNGTVAYDVTGNYNATISKLELGVEGKLGTAFNWDYNTGDSAVVIATSVPTITDDVSISMWVYITANSIANSRLIQSNGILVYKSTSTHTQIQANFTTRGYWRFDTPSSGVWHHIVITYNMTSVNNNPIVYIDGTSVTVTRATKPVGTSPVFSSLYIGNRANRLNSFEGYIDQILIYNKLLNQSEVDSLYNSGNGRAYVEF